MKWINDNAAGIQALGSLVLVFVTTAYVLLTKSLLDESRRSRRPYVYLDIKTGAGGLQVGVGNHGDRAAEEVRFLVSEDFEGFEGVRLREAPPFADGIDYIPPGRRYDFVLDAPDSVMAEASDARLDVEIRYSGDGRNHSERVALTLGKFSMLNLNTFSDSGDRIALALDRLPSEYFRRRKADAWLNGPHLHCPSCGEPRRRADATRCPHCHVFVRPESDIPMSDGDSRER